MWQINWSTALSKKMQPITVIKIQKQTCGPELFVDNHFLLMTTWLISDQKIELLLKWKSRAEASSRLLTMTVELAPCGSAASNMLTSMRLAYNNSGSPEKYMQKLVIR